MKMYKEIIITWSGKKSVKSIEDLKNINADKENVLYQIYGDHHIYGRDVLLYIGISKNAENRFRTHLKGVFGVVNNLSVNIGELNNYSDDLEIPESILVANHKPSFNKEFIHDVSPKAKKCKIIVINNGVNEMLQTCSTNFWWVL